MNSTSVSNRVSTSPARLLIAKVVLGTVVIAALAKVQLPFYPVPLTGLTFGVMAASLAIGWRGAMLSALAYLAAGLAGAPIFATAAIGPAAFVGPTAGYLMALPLLAAGYGFAGERRGLAKVAIAFAASTLHLLLGAANLSGYVGIERALAVGFIPFLFVEAVKATVALGGAHLVTALANATRKSA